MIDFGYGLTPSSAIDLDKMDRTHFEILIRREPDVLKCMACGSCGATCPAGHFSGMSVRKVLLNLQRGREDEVFRLMSNCMLCGKCIMVCPRGINTRHIVLSICRIYGKEEKR